MALSSSLQFSRSVVSDSLQPHELTAALQESLSITTPRASPNSCPLSRWCYPSNSSSVISFFSCNLVFPDVSNWLHFTPLHCLSSAFPPFLSNGASCDTESLSHRLCTSYPILDWFLSRSAVCPAGILGFPSHGVDGPDSWFPRLSLSWVSFILLHN